MNESALAPTVPSRWLLPLVAGIAIVAVTLRPSWAQDEGEGSVVNQNPNPGQFMTSAGGGTADSNRDMIAVTGVDVTGASVLYLVNTRTQQIAAYQATGGGGSTQGIKFVGARNISLDMRLDGFNDKTESNGRPLKYKDLEEQFAASGLLDD